MLMKLQKKKNPKFFFKLLKSSYHESLSYSVRKSDTDSPGQPVAECVAVQVSSILQFSREDKILTHLLLFLTPAVL